jgi:hypothetical protein
MGRRTGGNDTAHREGLPTEAVVGLAVVAGIACVADTACVPHRADAHGPVVPPVGFIVTNLSCSAKRVVRFYNQRGTAEQWIKEGKNAVKWTRLSCHDFADNQVRVQVFVSREKVIWEMSVYRRSVGIWNRRNPS